MATRGKIQYDVTARTAQFTAQMGMVNKSLLGVQGSMKAMGATMVAILPLFAATGALGKAVKTLATFERQMSKVAAISGATGGELMELTENAKLLGATTRFTASEVAGLTVEFSKLGFTSKEILGLSKATLTLASVADTDLVNAAKVAGETMRAFGLDVSESGRVVDVLAAAFSSSALDIEKWSSGMSNVAPIATALGISLERVTAQFAILVNTGVDASKATTDLRNIFLKAKADGIDLADAFKQIRESADPASKALEFFEKRNVASAISLAKNHKEVDKLEASLLNVAGTAQKMSDIMEDNLIGDWIQLKSAIEGVVIGIGNAQWMRDMTQALKEMFNTIRDGQTAMRNDKLDEYFDLLFQAQQMMIKMVNGEDIDVDATVLSKTIGLLIEKINALGFAADGSRIKIEALTGGGDGSGGGGGPSKGPRSKAAPTPLLTATAILANNVSFFEQIRERSKDIDEIVESWGLHQSSINENLREALQLTGEIADEKIDNIKIGMSQWNEGLLGAHAIIGAINLSLGITGDRMKGLSKFFSFIMMGLNIVSNISGLITPGGLFGKALGGGAGLSGLATAPAAVTLKLRGPDLVGLVSHTGGIRAGVGVTGGGG